MEVSLCPVPNVEHMHGITLNGEQNTESFAPRAVEKLPDFFGKMPVLRGKWATFGEFVQGINSLDKSRKPTSGCLGRSCTTVLICGVEISLRIGLDDDAVAHA